MKVIRFYDQKNTVRYGVRLAGNVAQLITGDLFGKFRVTRQKSSIKKLLAPITPPNILAIGLNYRAHAYESGAPYPERPLLFIKATTTLTNPGDPILLPSIAPNEVDYEVELCVVIGKVARNVPRQRAKNYILGYTIGNDVSARDEQLRLDKQWARGKSHDTFCPLGPCLLIPDKEDKNFDPDHCGLRSRLNGKVMQESNTSDMIFNVAELVSFLSQNMTLLPGTVIMTGTPAGVGFSRKPPVFLRAGDIMECEIDGIGVLRNPVERVVTLPIRAPNKTGRMVGTRGPARPT